jgi:uncharacterized protein
LDTSALVKLYIREPGTERMLRLAASPPTQMALLALAEVELRSAVRRRQRAGDLDAKLADDILFRFGRHLETKFLRQTLNEVVIETASALLDRHPLRAYDAIQLSGCLSLRSSASEDPVFVCADANLLKAAEAEGLIPLDPAA